MGWAGISASPFILGGVEVCFVELLAGFFTGVAGL